ncbi:hypothetical protein SAY86_011685 [Trapa natans]|uniref:CTLH domain-containing protein n=1 Tax=Trapa natans TaxID=22666 RepID=A0AAN7LXF2_TRANT|nr:hypothetical protein SAY86_011685 [Trapa natans]
MGGVEDETEPSRKRIRLSHEVLRDLANGLSIVGSNPDFSGDLMARSLPIKGDEEIVGSKGVIKRVEFVRIITQALYSLGYENSGARLQEESGVSLQSSVVNLLIQQVLNGKWNESLATLKSIGLLDESIIKSASFLILEQKYFELLDDDKVMDALKTLRMEITPLSINNARVREISWSILFPVKFVHVDSSNFSTTRAKSRAKLLAELQKLLPPHVMIPDRRLEHLVEQALILQRDTCMFHNSEDNVMSLYKDHQCGRDQIPSRTLQVLEAHNDEVWFLQFSHDGKCLASASNDRTTIIWEVDSHGDLSVKHKLSGHQKPVSSMSWSPDDSQILTCGVEENVRRWDASSGECLHVYEKAGYGFVSCAWFPDGKSMCLGVNDKSICMWDLEGKELQCWKGQRILKISDLQVMNDGKQIISTCRESSILLLDVEAKVERLIEEDQAITSFSLSRDNRFLLVNLLNQEIHLWNIEGEVKLVAKYKGHKRTCFLIRSCFGGLEEAFIASGSEDSQVYIWHRGSGELIQALPGHSGVVNCVAWNPANSHMLASASDDHTIRIWGLNDLKMKHKGPANHCNGVHYCNRKTDRGETWL